MASTGHPKVWFRRKEDMHAVQAALGFQRTTLVWGARTMICEMKLAKGSEVAPHHHPYEQIGYVASGKLQFKVDGESAVLSAGEAYVIPPDITHEVLALEDSVAIDVFSPPRPDYMG